MDTDNNTPRRQGQVGAVIGIIIIVVILALGGLYVWGARLNRAEDTTNEAGPSGQSAKDISQAGDPALDNLKTQGTSDELGAIEDDLDTTSLDGLDAEVSAINTEIQ